MTVGTATAQANAILNCYRNVSAAVATPFVKLHTGDPGAAGTANAAVGSTTRNAVVWSAASGGSMALSTLSAWTNGGTSETISHLSVWDASTAGTFLFSVALTSSQAWASTNTLTVTSLTLTYSPLAA